MSFGVWKVKGVPSSRGVCPFCRVVKVREDVWHSLAFEYTHTRETRQ